MKKKTPHLITRLCKEKDLKSVCPLYNSFNRSRYTLIQFKKFVSYTKGRDFIFCGEIEGRVVGYIIVKIDWDIEYAGVRAEITDFFVQRKYRYQGLGRRLITQAFQLAKKKKAKTITLLVDDGPSPAKSLYRSVGFRKKKDTILMEAPLS